MEAEAWVAVAFVLFLGLLIYLGAHRRVIDGVDGLSVTMVILTALVSLVAVGASWNIEKQLKGYLALFLLLEVASETMTRRASDVQRWCHIFSAASRAGRSRRPPAPPPGT